MQQEQLKYQQQQPQQQRALEDNFSFGTNTTTTTLEASTSSSLFMLRNTTKAQTSSSSSSLNSSTSSAILSNSSSSSSVQSLNGLNNCSYSSRQFDTAKTTATSVVAAKTTNKLIEEKEIVILKLRKSLDDVANEKKALCKQLEELSKQVIIRETYKI